MGVLDMNGNVLEWCLNENEKPNRMIPTFTCLIAVLIIAH
jgi:formylglycine-generating enzyme required for sulfatase activity